jgi:hypothetical protein
MQLGIAAAEVGRQPVVALRETRQLVLAPELDPGRQVAP